MKTTRQGGSDQLQKPATRWLAVLAWGGFAALAGLYCVVLPPHLIPGAIVRAAYGWPLLPWFASAFANLCFLPTLVLMFVLGAALGLAQPRWWPLSSCLTISLPILLDAINIAGDWMIDSTSHNLLPFEIAALMVFALPALAGGALGSLIRRAIH